MVSGAKTHSFEEVANHNKIKDCWLIISGKVYDVTPFMDEHPGGGEVLLSATGKDGTNDFEDIGHSDEAREMMEKYYIGVTDSKTVPTKRTYIPPQETPNNANAKASESLVKMLRFLLPLFILGLALTLGLYTKKD
ncbi:Cytochrome b5 [Hibiscus syriacus]|uniref:Cytochrome b5 n=1 Tax=Hibiscus syriacus TaxID=106335 RepID=A0A6A2XRQ0_HIBSY|nr:cytochrome b5-like [Hibiscus syriacus]KAE8678252.1 Cytochrome b5 [Hibiscus syriacus]